MKPDRRPAAHRVFLPAACLLIACGPSGCVTRRNDPAPAALLTNSQQKPSLQRLTARAKEIEDTLRGHRDRFLRTQQPEEVFAVFYYHVTAELRRRVAAGELKFPVIILEGLAEFFAAYEWNREPSRREAHWRPYYEKAARLRGPQLHWWQVSSPLDVVGASGLIGLGVRAHIDYDLPRTLKSVLGRHPELTAGDLTELEREFDALGKVFDPAAHRAFADVAAAAGKETGPHDGRISVRDRVAGWTVQRKRRRAWEKWEDSASPSR